MILLQKKRNKSPIYGQKNEKEKKQKKIKKSVDKTKPLCYNNPCRIDGSIAQLGEHLPYKQRVIGSSPIVPTNGLVVQLVRTLACHARGQGFEPPSGRQKPLLLSRGFLLFFERICYGRNEDRCSYPK